MFRYFNSENLIILFRPGIWFHKVHSPILPQILTSGLQVLTSGLEVLTSGLHVLSSGLQVLSSGLQVLSSGLQVLSSGLQVILVIFKGTGDVISVNP